MLIEDVVCPVENLADMTADLIQLFKDHGYRDASAVGHALEGNLHLVFSQVRGCTARAGVELLPGACQNSTACTAWRRLATVATYESDASIPNICWHCWAERTLSGSGRCLQSQSTG